MNRMRLPMLVLILTVDCFICGYSAEQTSEPPNTEKSAGKQQSTPWSLQLRYGGGTPNDAGPLGHCIATFTNEGHVRIESKGRQGVVGPSDVVVYETKSLGHEQLQSIFKAADDALREKPFVRRGENADGEFLVLERTGNRPAQIGHYQLNGFSEAPPAMQNLVALLNELLPENERIPLKKRAQP
jgi:hypothetical protein